ncbi:MAG: hypothetical protein ACRDJC_26805, partial [Thermomicrobiales bacterium]
MAAPGTPNSCIAATSASATIRNAGEASAARVLGIASGGAVGSPATGVPAVAAAGTGEAMGVTWAADRRIGAATTAKAAAPPASAKARRREN